MMYLATPQWVCLRLRSRHPGFDSQAHHVLFYHFQSTLCYICPFDVRKRMKINKKRPGLAHLTKETRLISTTLLPWQNFDANSCNLWSMSIVPRADVRYLSSSFRLLRNLCAFSLSRCSSSSMPVASSELLISFCGSLLCRSSSRPLTSGVESWSWNRDK